MNISTETREILRNYKAVINARRREMGRNRSPPRRLLMKSAILWRISRLFSWAVTTSYRTAETGDAGQSVEARLSARRENPWQAGRLPEMRGAAPAALPARLSGQKVVYGCMQGTGVIFRDTVTVSGCLLLRPLRLPAAWRHPVVRPDSDRQLLAHPPVSAEPAGAVSGCRYGPMRENPACSDRSGRAAPVAP